MYLAPSFPKWQFCVNFGHSLWGEFKTRSLFDANQGTVTKEPIQVPIGPITRARAKRIKESLNRLIQCILTEINSRRPKDNITYGPQGWISIIQALE